MNRGAIILCGGQSTRMGRDKALLPFGPREVMLERVARLVRCVVPIDRLVCVASPGQLLPALPAGAQLVFDPVAGRGPLAGMAAGLATLEPTAAAFVTGCDAPRLKPEFVERMFELLGEHQIAACHDGQRWHPLPAVYHASIRPRLSALLAAGERSLLALLECSDTCRVSAVELRDVDPELASLATCNTPAEYESALWHSGLATPE